MADVAIIVPTLRRPQSLERALRSLFGQTGVADRVSEIVVVDNEQRFVLELSEICFCG